MSDITNDFPVTPGAEDDEIGIPDDVVKSVLAGMGFDHPPEETVTEVADPAAPVLDDDLAVLPPVLPDDPNALPVESLEVEEEETDDAPPTPPGGPIWSEEGRPASEPSSDQPLFTQDQVAELVRAELTRLLPQQVQAPAPIPAPVPQPPLPQLPANLDFEDPAVQAFIAISAAQQQRIEGMGRELESQKLAVQERRLADATEIINAATSNFQRTYNLPDEVMAAVSATASRSTEPARLYMSGVDPRTDTHVNPDPYKAAEVTFEMAYWNTPSARQFEIERQSAHRQAATARKAKLGGVGGSSASASRAPRPLFDETTEEGRHSAAVEFARQAMFGDEQQ